MKQKTILLLPKKLRKLVIEPTTVEFLVMMTEEQE